MTQVKSKPGFLTYEKLIEVAALFDTGSTLTYTSETAAEKIGLNPHPQPKTVPLAVQDKEEETSRKKPVSFLLWIPVNFVAWLVFWLFIEPIGAWILYGRYYGTPFSAVIGQIGKAIVWLPMGLFYMSQILVPLGLYGWLFWSITIASYVIYRVAWRKRNS